MSLDYQQVRQQIQALGEQAPLQARHLAELHRRASERLARHAQDQAALRQRVQTVTRLYDPNLRCALPALKDPEPAEHP